MIRIHTTRITIGNSLLILFAFFIPHISFATTIDSKSITKNEVWTYTGNPYNVYGSIIISNGASLTINKGVQIEMHSARFTVEDGGKLLMIGTETSPINIAQDTNSYGFSVKEAESYIESQHVNINGGKKILSLFNNAEALLSHTSIKSVSSNEYAISSWGDASLTITSSTFDTINSPGAVEAFGGSKVSISDSVFNHAGSMSTLSLYGRGILNTIANLEDVTITYAKNGIEIFNDAIASLRNVSVKNATQDGLLLHDGADVEIQKSEFISNGTGIESYNSSSTITESIIEGNKMYGAYVSGGTMNASKNWWGNTSGPFFEARAIKGTGDVIDGDINPSPWLTEKPLNEKCCSSVLFIPGIEGSRLYQGGRFGENQLWEPNRNADVEKLFLTPSGVPVEKDIYGRDIILRTNIGFGRFDKDIYAGLSSYLNKMDASFTIRDWQYAPYDWRLFSTDIVNNGFSTKERVSAKPTIKRIEDQVRSMASISKTKKVTLIAHSYGGFVAKELIRSLNQKGLAHLIDKVIMIGVPEEGSVSSMIALLHGDNQDIGRGYILNQSTARRFALNMPSAYSLLPTDTLLNTLSSVPVIKFATTVSFGVGNTNAIHDMARLTAFLKNEGNTRYISLVHQNTNIPAKLNALLFDKAVVQHVDLSLYQIPDTIQVINILGTGLKTLRGISYIEKSCLGVLNGDLLTDECRLNHIPLYSNEGDGTVSSKTLSSRKGLNLLFDMAMYNNSTLKNIAHADMASAEPVLQTIGQLLLNRFQIYKIPDYIYVLTQNNQSSFQLPQSETYQIALSEGVVMQAKNKEGLITGFSKENKKVLSVYSDKNAMGVINQIPNSSYTVVGSNTYLLTPSLPTSLSVMPTTSLEENNIFTFTLDVQKAVSGANDMQSNTNVFQFKDIPVEPESKISVDIVEGSTTLALLKVDNSEVSGNKNDITLYEPLLPNPATGVYIEQSTQVNSINPTIITTNGGSTGIASIDILWLISKLKTDIQKSSIRTNFKLRYLSRLNKIESYIKAGKIKGYAETLTYRTAQSLELIKKELKRARPLYYTGGLSLREATLLQVTFTDLSQALTRLYK